MSESLVVTIVFEEGEDGWIVASIPEVPGAHSQGRSREEARSNVIDALRGRAHPRTPADTVGAIPPAECSGIRLCR